MKVQNWIFLFLLTAVLGLAAPGLAQDNNSSPGQDSTAVQDTLNGNAVAGTTAVAVDDTLNGNSLGNDSVTGPAAANDNSTAANDVLNGNTVGNDTQTGTTNANDGSTAFADAFNGNYIGNDYVNGTVAANDGSTAVQIGNVYVAVSFVDLDGTVTGNTINPGVTPTTGDNYVISGDTGTYTVSGLSQFSQNSGYYNLSQQSVSVSVIQVP